MKRYNGFSLAETLIGAALLSVMILGLASFAAQQMHQSSGERLKANLSAVKARLLQTASSDAAWITTVSSASSDSHLSCIGSPAGCSGLVGIYDFDLYKSDGALVFSKNLIGGYQLNGSACPNPVNCPILLRLTWTPSCSSSDLNCRNPLVQIAGTFSSSVLGGDINLNKYNFTLNRSPISLAVCSTVAAPVCGGGQVAICRPTGWACVSTNAPTCVGAVSWIDGGTSYGPCTSVVGPPGLLHNTNAAVTNTAPGKIGTANFLCIPGQPMNGFIQQASATCAPTSVPINGVCGAASGNVYANAAATSAAGLCSAGSLSAAISGAGPWSWSCNGSGGGTSSSCAASNVPTYPHGTCAYILYPGGSPGTDPTCSNSAVPYPGFNLVPQTVNVGAGGIPACNAVCSATGSCHCVDCGTPASPHHYVGAFFCTYYP